MTRKRRRVLTETEERIVRRELDRGATDAEAQAAAGISARKLYDARRNELRDVPRQRRGPRPGREYPPQPEFVDLPIDEIYRRAAELRAERWSEEEHRERYNPGFSGESPA
jgi:hypothetical protein